MTRRLALVVVLGLAGAGCSIGDSGSTSGTEPDDVAETTVVDNQTEPPATPEPCSSEALTADIGVPMVLASECSDGWAMAAEEAYLEQCQECESALLVNRLAGTWKVTFSCYGYLPLSSDICSRVMTSSFPAGSVDTATRLPSLKTACAIWPMNTYSEFLVSAGCFGDVEDLRYSEIPECPKPYIEVNMAPVRICSKGRIVRDIQQALADAGYRVSADGFFGVGTLRAYIRWQKDNGLLVTGEVDEADLCRLGVPQC